MNNTKRKGARAEHRAIGLLTAAGYSCTRAAASLGVFDIIAIGPRDVRLVQVKAGKRCALSPADRAAIRAFVAPVNTSRELWQFFDYVKHPVITRIG